MREILAQLRQWEQAKRRFAIATVTKVYGSAPRPLGAKMLISAKGEIEGSVSGGCVEGAVVEHALDSLSNRTTRLVPFGISNQMAWEVGLACGGQIEVLIQPHDENDPISSEFLNAVERNRPVALATVLNGPGKGDRRLMLLDGSHLGSVRNLDIEASIDAALEASLRSLTSERTTIQFEDEPMDVLIEVVAPQPRLVIFGAVHIAIPLVSLASVLGYRTIVVDARRSFATRERFPHADELIVAWPDDAIAQLQIDENTAVVTLTHDEKLDVPALAAALRSPARYVGALGSARTHAKRVETLLADGLPSELIEKIHAPVGLDLGGRTVEEIALAILAQIIAQKNGRSDHLSNAMNYTNEM